MRRRREFAMFILMVASPLAGCARSTDAATGSDPCARANDPPIPGEVHGGWTDSVAVRESAFVVGYCVDGTDAFPIARSWNGERWIPMKLPAWTDGISFAAVDASGPNEVWVVGAHGLSSSNDPVVLRFDGHTWSREPTPPGARRLSGIAVLSPEDVWVAGSSIPGQGEGQELSSSTSVPFVAHRDGSAAWAIADFPTIGDENNTLLDVAGRDPRGVWTVGYYLRNESARPIVGHWEGSSWGPKPLRDMPSEGSLLKSRSSPTGLPSCSVASRRLRERTRSSR